MELDSVQIRTIIYYCYARGLNPEQISREMNQIGDGNLVSVRTCRNWVNEFKTGNYDLKDKEKSGRLADDELDNRIEEYLSVNRHATSRDMATAFNIGKSTVCRHLKSMGKRYLCFRWIPHQLSDDQKNNRVAICSQLLEMYHRNNFLNQLITVDEIWLYWENVGATPGQHHRVWHGAGDQPCMVMKRGPMTTKKHLCIVFWDSRGIILVETLQRGETINAEKYCAALDNLKEALRTQRRRNVNAGFNNLHMLQDNARPHTAQITQRKLREIGFNVLPHPPYSPDLSPSDYYLFSPLKASLKNQTFACAADLNRSIVDWYSNKPDAFYHKGIHLLPKRWQQCIEAGGAYFIGARENDDDL